MGGWVMGASVGPSPKYFFPLYGTARTAGFPGEPAAATTAAASTWPKPTNGSYPPAGCRAVLVRMPRICPGVSFGLRDSASATTPAAMAQAGEVPETDA